MERILDKQKYYKRIAMPAAGKSYGAIRYMEDQIRGKGKRFVLAAISVELCEQLANDFQKDIRLKVIITKSSGKDERVQDRFLSELEEKEYDVLIVTHKNLINCSGKYEALDWDIVVDELPNIHASMYLKIPSLEDDTLSRWLTRSNPEEELHNFHVMELKCGFREVLQGYIGKFEEVRDEDSLMNKKSQKGLEGLLKEGGCVLRKQSSEGEVEYAFNYIYHPEELFPYNEVIFLCAEFDNQLTGLLFKHKFNIHVEEKQEISLRKTQYDKPSRIKIYPLIKAPKAFSRNLSESWYCTKTGEKRAKYLPEEPSYIEFFEHLVNTASKIVGDEGYIYTVNKFREDMISQGEYSFLEESDRVKRLKYNPHGLNNYMDYNVALGMFCCNPRPTQKMLFARLDEECNVPAMTFQKGYESTAMKDPVFQLITRTKIRDFDNLEEITCIVPDYRCVDYLLETWFEGATVVWDYAVEVKETLGRHGKYQKLFNMDSSQSKAYNRWVHKQGWKPSEMSIHCEEQYNRVIEWWKETYDKEKT